jgi:hypothetical protein
MRPAITARRYPTPGWSRRPAPRLPHSSLPPTPDRDSNAMEFWPTPGLPSPSRRSRLRCSSGRWPARRRRGWPPPRPEPRCRCCGTRFPFGQSFGAVVILRSNDPPHPAQHDNRRHRPGDDGQQLRLADERDHATGNEPPHPRPPAPAWQTKPFQARDAHPMSASADPARATTRETLLPPTIMRRGTRPLWAKRLVSIRSSVQLLRRRGRRGTTPTHARLTPRGRWFPSQQRPSEEAR